MLIAASFGAYFLLVWTAMNDTSRYEITGLRLSQDGTAVSAKWNDAGACRYKVMVYDGIFRRKSVETDDTKASIKGLELDNDYRVFVLAGDEGGSFSGMADGKIDTEKVQQEISAAGVKPKSLKGVAGTAAELDAEAKGALSYKSSDEGVVAVDKGGGLKFKKEGKAVVKLAAAETDCYRKADAEVEVTVYPEKLGTPELKADGMDDFSVTFKWGEVDFAEEYRLFKLNPATGKYEQRAVYKADKRKAVYPRDKGEYKLRAYASVGDKVLTGAMSAKAEVESTAASADTYSSAHDLKTLDMSNLELVTGVSGYAGAGTAQSFSLTDAGYVVTFCDGGGSAGAFVTYDFDGNRISEVGAGAIGVANGSTCNRNTGRIYTVRTHKATKSAECTTFDMKNQGERRSFTLPKVTSGIAYDPSIDKFILSKGNELYRCDTDFNVEKFFWKRARYNHAQDIGAYNGVAMVCTWVGGNTSYIDLYRMTDGAYLGSYYVPIGEIESCMVVDKHLTILILNSPAGNCILRTKEPIAVP